MKNLKLNQWMWKWHFIAGIVSLPIILLLSVTGIIYLFNKDVVQSQQKPLKTVVLQGEPISYQEQLQVATANAIKRPTKMVIPQTNTEATEFISGMRSDKSSIFIDPYTKLATGTTVIKDTWMYKVRKLHGELLLGDVGTLFVELTACWMIMLIISGLYIWWPVKKWKTKGLFTIRTGATRQLMWRDIHAVTSFWIFVLLLITLAGGLPWTKVWGGAFKKVQKVTNTGYPETWRGKRLKSTVSGNAMTLDAMVAKAKSLNLPGTVSINLPKGKNSVFSVSNRYRDLNEQKVLHFDQYSGALIKKHNWNDVGVLMRGRQWAMRFHQGELAPWNWWLMLGMAILFTLSSISAIISYILRKKFDRWGIPKVPASFNVDKGIIGILVVLGILFPLFGMSLIVIVLFDFINSRRTVTR